MNAVGQTPMGLPTPGTTIETERLRLRSFQCDDDRFVLRMFNDPSFLRFIGDRSVRTLEQARSYIADRLLPVHHSRGMGPFLVQLKTTRSSIGFCTLFQRDWLQAPDLGFAFLPEYRAQGYAVEASRALLEHARIRLRCTAMVAIAAPENTASDRLLRKLGFRPDGTVKPPGEDAEVVLFTTNLV